MNDYDWKYYFVHEEMVETKCHLPFEKGKTLGRMQQYDDVHRLK